jgi:hypothetical protein
MKTRNLCKVAIPFRRTDLQPIKFSIDMIFLDDEPYAVTDWAMTPAGEMPTYVLKLDKQHLQRDRTGSQNYTYAMVLDDPRLRV